MRGKLYIFEGVDGVGKTSIVKEVEGKLKLKKQKVLVVRPLAQESTLGKVLHKHPTSISFYLMILKKTLINILPKMILGYTVLCDRHIETVDTFSPDNRFIKNKIFRKLLAPLLVTPDLYVYVTAKENKITERLSKDTKNTYHQKLVSNPKEITNRQIAYQKIFDKHAGPKIRLDTSNETVDSSSKKLLEEIKKYVS